MHWDSIGVSNVFLAVIALTSIAIVTILYERFIKKDK
jgi:hypothetical protein